MSIRKNTSCLPIEMIQLKGARRVKEKHCCSLVGGNSWHGFKHKRSALAAVVYGAEVILFGAILHTAT